MANDGMSREAFDAMLRGDGLFWDCEVKASDQVFRANRYQLSRCKRMRDFFKSNPAVHRFADDCCSSVLDLSEFSGEAVLEMLRWLYLGCANELTAKIDTKKYVVEEVYVLACDWGVQLLREQCLNAVESPTVVVTDENFIRLTRMAMVVKEQADQARQNDTVAVRGEEKPDTYYCYNSNIKCAVESFYKRWLNVFIENFNKSPKNVVEKLKKEGFLNRLILLKASEDNIELLPINEDTSNINNEQVKISAPCDEKFFSEVSSSVSICSSSSVSKILDFKIFCIDSPEDRPILCHKMALARVPRWARMFENESEESQRGSANVEICVAAMLEVLRYMYMGLNEDLTRVLPAILHLPERYLAEDVLLVSHEYGVDELTQRCFKGLLKCEVNTDNVIRLLQLACLYDAAELKEKFLRYFVQNRELLLHDEDCDEGRDDWKRVLGDANLHVAIAIVDTVLPKVGRQRSSSADGRSSVGSNWSHEAVNGGTENEGARGHGATGGDDGSGPNRRSWNGPQHAPGAAIGRGRGRIRRRYGGGGGYGGGGFGAGGGIQFGGFVQGPELRQQQVQAQEDWQVPPWLGDGEYERWRRETRPRVRGFFR